MNPIVIRGAHTGQRGKQVHFRNSLLYLWDHSSFKQKTENMVISCVLLLLWQWAFRLVPHPGHFQFWGCIPSTSIENQVWDSVTYLPPCYMRQHWQPLSWFMASMTTTGLPQVTTLCGSGSWSSILFWGRGNDDSSFIMGRSLRAQVLLYYFLKMFVNHSAFLWGSSCFTTQIQHIQ